MGIFFEMLLVERDLAVRRLGFADPAGSSELIGPQVRQHMLDTPQAVSPGLDPQAERNIPSVPSGAETDTETDTGRGGIYAAHLLLAETR